MQGYIIFHKLLFTSLVKKDLNIGFQNNDLNTN